jgi:hypothetical protein
MKAYWGHPELGPLFDCASACADQDGGTCTQACAARFPNVGPALQAMTACTSSCTATCR